METNKNFEMLIFYCTICIASYLRIPSLPGTSPLLHPNWSFNVLFSLSLCSRWKKPTIGIFCIFAQGISMMFIRIDQSPSCFLRKFAFLPFTMELYCFIVLCWVGLMLATRERAREKRRNGKWWRLPDNWPEPWQTSSGSRYLGVRQDRFLRQLLASNIIILNLGTDFSGNYPSLQVSRGKHCLY